MTLVKISIIDALHEGHPRGHHSPETYVPLKDPEKLSDRLRGVR